MIYEYRDITQYDGLWDIPLVEMAPRTRFNRVSNSRRGRCPAALSISRYHAAAVLSYVETRSRNIPRPRADIMSVRERLFGEDPKDQQAPKTEDGRVMPALIGSDKDP